MSRTSKSCRVAVRFSATKMLGSILLTLARSTVVSSRSVQMARSLGEAFAQVFGNRRKGSVRWLMWSVMVVDSPGGARILPLGSPSVSSSGSSTLSDADFGQIDVHFLP